MKTINENNGLTIEQLEERFEMVVASKGSSDDPCMSVDPCACGNPCQDGMPVNNP